jgi:hypothetical protein
VDQEGEAQDWIESILGEKFPPGVVYEDAIKASLQSHEQG